MSYFIVVNRPGCLFVFSLVATFLWFTFPLASQTPPLPHPGDSTAVYAFVQNLSPRGEGSPAERKIFQALASWFGGRVEALHRTDFQTQTDFHSFSQSLWFRIPGKAPGELVMVVPTDSEEGQSNNAGLAWAVQWADQCLTRQPGVSLTFFFTGAERGSGSLAALGSRQFLKDFFPKDPAAAIVLDIDTMERPINLIAESGAFPSPIWLSRGLLETLQSGRFLPEIQGTQPQIFRFDLPERRNVLQPWFDRDIPAIWITSSSRAYPAGALAQRSLPRVLTEFVDAQIGGLPGHWDKHYLYFHLGNFQFFLSQQVYLFALLGILGVILLVFLLFSQSLQNDLSSLVQGLWQLPVLFSFLFLFLFAGTLWTQQLFAWRGFGDFWKYSALPVLGLKIAVAVGLYFAVFLQFRRLPLSRWPGFYSYAALLILGIGVLGSAAVELSFSFYFLWALVFAVLFHIVPWRPLKFLAFLLSPLWFVKSFIEIFWLTPDSEMIRITLVSTFAGNLALDAVLFPFLLLVNSYHYYRHQRQERNEKHRSRITLALWVFVSLGLSLVLLRSDPFQDKNTPLLRAETLDLHNRTRVEDVETPIPADLPPQRKLPFVNGVWNTAVSRDGFLDRLAWTVHFDAFRQPESVVLTLEGDQDLVVYDANFPYTLDATGTQVKILIGRTPPSSFDLRITLGADVEAHLQVEALFTAPSEREYRRGRWYETTRQITVLDSRDLVP